MVVVRGEVGIRHNQNAVHVRGCMMMARVTVMMLAKVGWLAEVIWLGHIGRGGLPEIIGLALIMGLNGHVVVDS